MLNEARVQSTDLVLPDQTIATPRLGKCAEMFVADAHGRYYDAVKRGNVYMAVNTAAGALTLNSTTGTGLFVYNPPTSGKNLVLMRLCVALGSLPAGAAPLILTGGAQAALPATTWTLLTGTGAVNGVLAAFMGNANKSIAQAASAAQAVPNVIQRWIPGGPAATVAASTAFPPFIVDDIAGELIVGPGQLIGLQCLTTAITVGAALTWEEVPV